MTKHDDFSVGSNVFLLHLTHLFKTTRQLRKLRANSEISELARTFEKVNLAEIARIGYDGEEQR